MAEPLPEEAVGAGAEDSESELPDDELVLFPLVLLPLVLLPLVPWVAVCERAPPPLVEDVPLVTVGVTCAVCWWALEP